MYCFRAIFLFAMKKILFICLFLAFGSVAFAQPYKLAAGLRLGSPVSLSIKYLPSEKYGFEAFAGFRNYTYYSWTMLGGVVTRHQKLELLDIEGLSTFYGLGLAYFAWNWKDNWVGGTYSNGSASLVGQGGVEYKFENQPLAISLDWMPIISFSGYYRGFGAGYGAVSVRYVLK